MDAVVLPPSSEKPMDVTGWPAQVEALAVTLKGEPTAAFAVGLATVIPELLPEALGPDELDEPDGLDEPEPAGCTSAAVDALPPQPTLTIARTARRVTAIDKCLSSFNGRSLGKIGYWCRGGCGSVISATKFFGA